MLTVALALIASEPARADTIAVVIGGDALSASDSEAISDVVDPWVSRKSFKVVARVLDDDGVRRLEDCFVRNTPGCPRSTVASAGVDRLLFFLVSRGDEGTILSVQLFSGDGTLQATADGACRDCLVPELALVTQRLVRAVWGQPADTVVRRVTVPTVATSSGPVAKDDELLVPSARRVTAVRPPPRETEAAITPAPAERAPADKRRRTQASEAPKSTEAAGSPQLGVRAVASSETDAKQILARADKLLGKGELDKADAEYARVAGGEFLPSAGFLGRARIAFERKAFDAAEKLSLAASRAGADLVEAGMLRAAALARGGRQQEAVKAYKLLAKRATGHDLVVVKAALEQLATDCPTCDE
jgi:hypothetical protein